MATTVIEKEIYGSSLCFWTGDPTKNSNFGDTYDVDTSSVMLFRNVKDNGGPGPTRIVKSMSVEPLWVSGYPAEGKYGPRFYYFYDVLAQPFIKSGRSNPQYFLFSGTNNIEWKLNEWGPEVELDVVNDVHFDDPFLLAPNEELKFRLYGCRIGSGTVAGALQTYMFTTGWNPNKVLKVRVELEDYVDPKGWYGRVSLNDLVIKAGILDPDEDQEVNLLDLREGSTTLEEAPFKDMTTSSIFQVNNLDFRGNYPWGGSSSSYRFMYSIYLKTEVPTTSRLIRRYVRYSGNASSDLEQNGLLQDIGPLKLKRGQYLTVVVHSFQFYFDSTPDIPGNRQMPAFWLNGALT